MIYHSIEMLLNWTNSNRVHDISELRLVTGPTDVPPAPAAADSSLGTIFLYVLFLT